MNAIIISIGTELTTGQTIDTNSAFLARELAAYGITTHEHITVGDDQHDIARSITWASQNADLVIVTGGLGPTEDDLTRQAMAAAMGTQLELNETCLKEIEEFFRSRNRPMHTVNRVQAMVPAGAEAIPNKVGTAPGLRAALNKAQVFVTPGVPSEMEWMFHNAIAPSLKRHDGVILHRIIRTFGAGESDLGVKIANLMKRGSNPLVGTTVAAGMVSIRIISHAETRQAAEAMSDKVAATLRERLGELIVGEGDATMPKVLGDLLRRRGQTVATAESCTGGLIGKMLTDVAGSSDYYVGGVITYANRLKTSLLGVDESLLAAHGAVSEPVATAMASGCRQRLGSDWAISVTGIAGPAGGSETKPVGLAFVGLSGPDGTQAHRLLLPGVREMIRLRAALTAMNFLRLQLLGK